MYSFLSFTRVIIALLIGIVVYLIWRNYQDDKKKREEQRKSEN